MEKLFVRTSAGFQLAAAIHAPREEGTGLVVLCPGYLDSKDYDHLIVLANDLATAGYTAARFDPLGTWGSDGPIDRYSMSQYVEDIGAIIDALCRKRPFEDIALVGHSIGGTVSLIRAAKDHRIGKTVAIMSPYAFVRPNLAHERDENSAWARTGYQLQRPNLPGRKETREVKVPYYFVEDSRRYDARKEVAKIKVPILLIAGEMDQTVPLEDIKMVYDRAPGPKKLVVTRGAEHNYRFSRDHVKAINKEVISFLDRRT